MTLTQPSVSTMEPQTPPRTTVDEPDTLAARTAQRRWTLTYWLSGALAVLALIASAIGVFFPQLFRDAAVTAGNARGTDLVILAVAIPALLISMALAARGSLRAQVVWLGALGYILYNAVFFAFAVVFNPLFLVYVGVLSLALWALVALLLAVDVARLRAGFSRGLQVRAIALYLIVTTLLFALTWLRDIVPALFSGLTPVSLQGTKMLTNPIQVVDLAVGFPLTILAAVWLWRRRAWGYALAGLFLVYGVIEAASVATDQLFGHISDPSQSLAMSPVFAALTIIALIPLTVYLRHLRHLPQESGTADAGQ